MELLPAADGAGYSVSFAGSTNLDDKVISICPIETTTGRFALATPNAVGGLRNGIKINGVIAVSTCSNCRIFKPATGRGASRSWDDSICDSAAVVRTEGGCSLIGLFGDGRVRAYSIPGLREFGSRRINDIVDMRRLADSAISSAGTFMCWTGPSEVALFSTWGTGIDLYGNPNHYMQ